MGVNRNPASIAGEQVGVDLGPPGMGDGLALGHFGQLAHHAADHHMADAFLDHRVEGVAQEVSHLHETGGRQVG